MFILVTAMEKENIDFDGKISMGTNIWIDKQTMKIMKWVGIISTVSFVGALIILFGEIEIISTRTTALVMLSGLYIGGPMMLMSGDVLLCGTFYFKRLKAYGYRIPEKRKNYQDKLENIPREAGSENITSLFQTDSKILAWIGLTIYLIFVGLDILFLMKWKFMWENAIAMFCISMLGYLVWLILAIIFYQQANTKRYRDDLEPDDGRKKRMNLMTGIGTYIILLLITLFAFITMNSMMDYVYRSQIDTVAEEQNVMQNTYGSEK